MDEPVYKLCKRGHVKSPDNVNAQGSCKQCNREYMRKYMREYTKIPKVKEYYRTRDNTPARKASRKAWLETPKGKTCRNRGTDKLTDAYVIKLLKSQSGEIINVSELINIKRNQILFKRSIKELKQAIKGD